MAAHNSSKVWQWISASLFSCLTGGAIVVWMLGTDAVGSEAFTKLDEKVDQLVVQQTETATELRMLRLSIEGHTP